MDEFRAIHKQCFAPTLAHLNRIAYPCRICRRNTLQEYLCNVCLAHHHSQLTNYFPLFHFGRFYYLPIPTSVSQERVLECMRFAFGLYHLSFDATVLSLPHLPTLLHVPGTVLLLRPWRCTDFAHFFLRKPDLIPHWECIQHESHIEFKLLEPRPFPIPAMHAMHTVQAGPLDHLRALNELFPK